MTTFELVIIATNQQELIQELISFCKQWNIEPSDMILKDYRGDISWRDKP